jgi:hypothetical protein
MKNPRTLSSQVVTRNLNEKPVMGNIGDNTFRGIVTPHMQQMRKMHKENYTIQDVISNPEFRNKFPQSEFPKLEQTAEGIFFQPITRVVSTTHVFYVKWFSLDSEFNISHDHNYQYVRIIPNGYLMKVSVPRTSDSISDFEVNYVTPVNAIQVSETINKALQEDASEEYNVQKFDPNAYPVLVSQLFVDSKNFIDVYLTDILDN